MKKIVLLLPILFLSACGGKHIVNKELFEEPLLARPARGQAILLFDNGSVKIYRDDFPNNKRCMVFGYGHSFIDDVFCASDRCHYENVAKTIIDIGGNAGIRTAIPMRLPPPYFKTMSFVMMHCE